MTALACSCWSEIVMGLQISLLKVVYSHFGEFVERMKLNIEMNSFLSSSRSSKVCRSRFKELRYSLMVSLAPSMSFSVTQVLSDSSQLVHFTRYRFFPRCILWSQIASTS